MPLPLGPFRTSFRPGQFCQSSIMAMAIALEGDTKKSSRPSAGRAERSKRSCFSMSVVLLAGKAAVEATVKVLLRGKPGDDTKGGGDRDGDQHADETEERAED